MITSDTEAVADHVNQARDFLAKSREYLTQGDLHQASQRGWGAAAHMAPKPWPSPRVGNTRGTATSATEESMAVRWPWKSATKHQDDGQPSFVLFYLTALYGISG